MLNTGFQKPPLAPKPKVGLSPKLGQSPACKRKEGLSLPSPANARKPKPIPAPKPIFPKVTTTAVSPGPKQKLPAGADSAVGLLNSQNGLHQENTRPNWDYIIPICLCSNEDCRCIKNETFSKLGKDLTITKKKSKTETEHRKVVSDDVKDYRESKSPTSEDTPQKNSTENSNALVIKNLKPFQEVITLYQNVNTVDNIYSPALSSNPSFPHKVLEQAKKTNVISQIAPGLAPKEENLSISNSAPTRKHPPVPVPRKPRAAIAVEQETVLDKIGNQEVNETSSKVKNRPPVSVNTPALPLLITKAPLPKPTLGPPVPPRNKAFLSDIDKSFSSEDVEEEDLSWDDPEMELAVDKSDNEFELEGDTTDEPIYNLIDCSVSAPNQPKEGVVGKLPQLKPLRRNNPMAGSIELFEDNNNEMPDPKETQPLQDTRELISRQLPLPPSDESNTHLTSTIKSQRSSTLSKAKSFSTTDASPPQKCRTNSFKRLLDLKLAFKKKMWRGKGSSNSETDSEDGNIPEFKEQRTASYTENRVDGEVVKTEAKDYTEEVAVYEEITDYVNVNVGEEDASPFEESKWPSPPPPTNDDDEGVYEEQDLYVKMEQTLPDPQEHYSCPRDFQQLDVDEEWLSDEDVLYNTTDEDDEEDEFDTSSEGAESEQTVESATLIRKKTKIQYIATEIMTSENVFVDVLKLLHVDFRNAVFAASRDSGKTVIEDRLLDQILYYLPQLYELNEQLLKELQQRVATWGNDSKVADIFVKKGPFLKLYSNYIREFDRNVALLEEQTKKNLAFGAVVKEFEASPCCAKLGLRHFLLKPIQRIPQYQLLLTDYLKNLSEDAADYKDTQEALVIVKEVANHANDIMKQGDIFQKLFQVQCRLIGNHEIVQPGRIFLKEGVVNKLSRKAINPKMMFLFNDMLLYTTPMQSGQFRVKHKLSLTGMKVKKQNREAVQNELIIVSVERSFKCSVSSATERDLWLDAISKAVSDFTKKKTSFVPGNTLEEVEIEDGATLGSKAPVWIQDSGVTMCMICTCEFSLTWRRHHCRACGKVVCQSCSANKYRLKYLKDQWARVCNECFVLLQKQENEKAISSTVCNKTAFAFSRKCKKIPVHLKEVSANTLNSTMSGYLEMIKPKKKQGKRMWFVIKAMILYTYAASEDVAAVKSQPLLGFRVKSDSKLQFRLLHKDKLFLIFKADDEQTAEKWIKAMIKASVLDG